MKLNTWSAKKIITLLTFSILSLNNSIAATVTSAATGNWSNAMTWNITTNRPGNITASTSSRIVTGSSLASFTTTVSVGSQILNSLNVVIGVVESIQSATSLTLVSNASEVMIDADWNSRGVGAGDVVSISSGHNITVDANYTCTSITFVTPLTNNIALNINQNVSLTVTTAFTMPIPGANFKISLNINDGNAILNNLTMQGSSSTRRTEINLINGSLDVNGTFASTSTTGSYLNITGTGSIYFSGTVPSTFTLSPGTGSNVIYDRNGAQTIKNTTYNNLTLAGSSTRSMNACTVNNILQIEGTPTLLGTFTYGSGAGLIYNTSTSRVSSTIEWPSIFSGTKGVEIKNTGVITLDAAKSMASGVPLNINESSSLTTNNFSLTFNGNFINNGNLNAGTSNIFIGGTLANQEIGKISTTGNIDCSKTSGLATFTGNVSCNTIISNATGNILSLGSAINVHEFETISLARGIIYGGNSTTTISKNIYSSGGTFEPEFSTLIFNGVSQTIQWGSYHNIILNGGPFTFPTLTTSGDFTIKGYTVFTNYADVSVTGNLNIQDNGQFNSAGYNVTVNGNLTIGDNLNSTSILNLNTFNTGSILINGDFNIKTGATFNNLISIDINIGGNLYNTGTFITGTSKYIFTGTNKSINSQSALNLNYLEINGVITNTAQLVIENILSGTGTLINAGTIFFYTISDHTISTLDASSSPNNIYYTGMGNQNIINTDYYHLELSGSGIKTILPNTHTIVGNLNLTGDITIILNNNISINGNLTISGNANLSMNSNVICTIIGDLTNTGVGVMDLSSGTISLDGVLAQNIQNDLGEIVFSNLLLNGGNKVANSNVTINSTLQINNNSSLQVGYGTTLNLNCTVSGTGKIKGSICSIDNLSKLEFSKSNSNIGVVNIDETLNYFYDISILNNCTVTLDAFGIFNSLNLTSGTLVVSEYIDISSSQGTPINKLNGYLQMSRTSSMSFGAGQTSSSPFTLPNSLFASTPTFKDFSLNRVSDLSLGTNDIILTGTLSITLGNLISNGKLTLLSDANGTARVASISNTNYGVIGNINVQRFIPGGPGKRKWRFLSFATNDNNFMRFNQLIDDILITAPAGAAGGFDVNPLNPINTASLRTYTESTTGTASNGWTDPNSINNTIATGLGFEVFVRGSRFLDNPYLNWTEPDNVTIDYTGVLNKGDITKTLSYTNTGNPSADGFNLVGNPYASTVDFKSEYLTKTNIQNKFWGYNPNTGVYGIYDATLDIGTNSITQYIASSQGFFVKATAANPSITFKENCKSDNPGNNYFKTNENKNVIPMIKIGISNDSTYSDETIVVFDEDASTLANDEHDANKWFSDALNIYTLSSDNVNLNIDSRKTPTHIDSIKLAVFSYNGADVMTTTHTINVNDMSSLPNNIDVVLWDKFLNTYTNLKVNSRYEFMITSDKNSYGKDRFILLVGDVNIGIPNNYNNSVLKVFPNPSKGDLYLTTSEEWQGKEINYSIIDQSGRKIISRYTTINNLNTPIDISSLSDGIYVLEVISEHKTNRIIFINRQ